MWAGEESRGLVSRSCSTIERHLQEVDLCNMTDHLGDIREGQRVKKNLPWELMPLIINFDREHK